MRTTFFALVAAICALATATGAGAVATQPFPVVMSGLDNPRGLALGPEGALYVAEAGRGGPGPCLTLRGMPHCYGATGAVSRLRRGEQERLVAGLPSVAGPTGGEAVGPHDISLLGRGADT